MTSSSLELQFWDSEECGVESVKNLIEKNGCFIIGEGLELARSIRLENFQPKAQYQTNRSSVIVLNL